MDGIVNWISKNPYWAAAGLFASFLGLLFAIVIPIVQRRKKSLSFTWSTSVLVKNARPKIDGLEILFEGRPVDSIYVTKIHIWNSGNTLIRESDFYPNKELEVGFQDKDAKVLSAKVERESADTCKTRTSINDVTKAIKISFDYLEKKQGAIISIYHANSEIVKIYGKLIEGKIRDKTPFNDLVEASIVPYMNATAFGLLVNPVKILLNIEKKHKKD